MIGLLASIFLHWQESTGEVKVNTDFDLLVAADLDHLRARASFHIHERLEGRRLTGHHLTGHGPASGDRPSL